MELDPVSLVVGALAAGAASGLTDAASSAINDAYARLKVAVDRLVHGKPDAEVALRRHEQDPRAWELALASELTAAGVVDDLEVIAAAQQVLALVDAAGLKSGKYVVDVRNSQGTVIGDDAHVTQTFGISPAS